MIAFSGVAQFVAHIGQKLRLHAARRLGGLFCGPVGQQFGFQAPAFKLRRCEIREACGRSRRSRPGDAVKGTLLSSVFLEKIPERPGNRLEWRRSPAGKYRIRRGCETDRYQHHGDRPRRNSISRSLPGFRNRPPVRSRRRLGDRSRCYFSSGGVDRLIHTCSGIIAPLAFGQSGDDLSAQGAKLFEVSFVRILDGGLEPVWGGGKSGRRPRSPPTAN